MYEGINLINYQPLILISFILNPKYRPQKVDAKILKISEICNYVITNLVICDSNSFKYSSIRKYNDHEMLCLGLFLFRNLEDDAERAFVETGAGDTECTYLLR